MYNPQLDTFMIVAHEGSFTKAAKQLYITPSAVLQQINTLEKNLEVTLFSRGRAGLTLTPAGEFLLKNAALLREQSKNIRSALKEINARGKSIIHVGVPKMHKSRCFYELWTKYSASHHDMSIDFIEASSNSLSDTSAAYSVCDIVEFVQLPGSWQSGMGFLKLGDCSLVFGVPKTNPLSASDRLTLEKLRGQTLVVNDGPFSELFKDYLNELRVFAKNIEYVPSMSPSLLESLYISGKILIIPSCSGNVHPGIIPLHCNYETTIPYGFAYSHAAAAGDDSFISFVKHQIETGSFIWTE